MKKPCDVNTLLLRIGIPFMTLLAVALVVGMWQWSENKGDYYADRAQKAITRQDYDRAANLAQKAESCGAFGLVNEVTYCEASHLFEQGDFEAAREKFASLGVYEDAAAYAIRCTAQQAKALEQEGDYAAAKELYRQAESVDGAVEGYQRCLYALAEAAETEDRLQEAFQQFWEVRAYSDAYDRALSIAYRITGQKDALEALRVVQGYSDEDWANRERLNEARACIEMTSVAAGWSHALLVEKDGTVRAFGDNACGQTEVSLWKSVTAVAAGAEHSLALIADGTVLAAGSNAYGQCDTASWKNVVAIAAGPWDSYGLCADGTVLHCGFADDAKLQAMQQIDRIEAGNASWVAIRWDGSLVCSLASGENAAWSEISDAAAGFGWTAVLFADGTAECTDYDLSGWTDVLELTSSTTSLVGICADGTLKAQALMPQAAALCGKLSAVQAVKGIAVSTDWAIILHEDDSISLVGDANFSLD